MVWFVKSNVLKPTAISFSQIEQHFRACHTSRQQSLGCINFKENTC